MYRKIRTYDFNTFISSINVVNIFIGYQLITSVLMPVVGNVSESTQITIPYRAFSLFIAVTAMILNINSKNYMPMGLKMFFMFWIIFLVRMFYDLEIQDEYFIPSQYKLRLWLYTIGLSFIPMISIYKSIKRIDLSYSLKWIYRLGIITLLITFFSVVQGRSNMERIDANMALDSISFGKTAVMIVLLALFQIYQNSKIIQLSNLRHFLVVILGLYIALRTGSRGPLIAFLFVFFLSISFKKKQFILSLIKFSILILITFIARDLLINIIGIVSPITEFRINEAMSGKDLSTANRIESYSWFVDQINDSPLLGTHFARLADGEFPGYAHNILLDILLGFGFLGLFFFLYIIFKATRNIYISYKMKNECWIGLLMLLYFTISLMSGAFYSNPELNISIVLTLLIFQTKNLVFNIQLSLKKAPHQAVEKKLEC